jgi:hypothetical protein
MTASPRKDRRHHPRLFATRVTPAFAVLVFLLLMLAPLVIVGSSDITAVLPSVGYLLLVLVTWAVVAGVRREPGSWLGQRTVRRALVAAIATDCVGIVATSSPGVQLGSITVLLLLLLVLLNIALGNATGRMATAPHGWVDEREEELRNRAHRLAYPVFAAVVGTILLADIASTPSREWVEHVLGTGGLFVFLELLFVLPGMVLAFIEPAPPPPESDVSARPRAVNVQARAAVALVLTVVALPLLASVGVVVLPLRTTSQVSESLPRPLDLNGGPAPAQTIQLPCHDFAARVDVGWGVVAELSVTAQWCGEGNGPTGALAQDACSGDVNESSTDSAVTVTPEQCTSTTGAGGAITATWRATVSPELLPFLSRQVTVQITVDKNGHVEVNP